MNGAYRALAEQYPELMTECECRQVWLKSCGCIPGSCPWCGDERHRPKRLDELLAMLEEAGWVYHLTSRRPGYAIWATGVEGGGRVEAVTPEEASARLWMAVTGREVRA